VEGSVPEGLKTRTWPQGEIPLKGRQTPFDYLERMHKYKKKKRLHIWRQVYLGWEFQNIMGSGK